jgi:hypothetical protein
MSSEIIFISIVGFQGHHTGFLYFVFFLNNLRLATYGDKKDDNKPTCGALKNSITDKFHQHSGPQLSLSRATTKLTTNHKSPQIQTTYKATKRIFFHNSGINQQQPG